MPVLKLRFCNCLPCAGRSESSRGRKRQRIVSHAPIDTAQKQVAFSPPPNDWWSHQEIENNRNNTREGEKWPHKSNCTGCYCRNWRRSHHPPNDGQYINISVMAFLLLMPFQALYIPIFGLAFLVGPLLHVFMFRRQSGKHRNVELFFLKGKIVIRLKVLWSNFQGEKFA